MGHSVPFAPPEAVDQQGRTTSGKGHDVWSLAVLFFDVLTAASKQQLAFGPLMRDMAMFAGKKGQAQVAALSAAVAAEHSIWVRTLQHCMLLLVLLRAASEMYYM